MFAKRLVFVLLIVVLGLLPSVSAQEGPKPEAVGRVPTRHLMRCMGRIGYRFATRVRS